VKDGQRRAKGEAQARLSLPCIHCAPSVDSLTGLTCASGCAGADAQQNRAAIWTHRCATTCCSAPSTVRTASTVARSHFSDRSIVAKIGRTECSFQWRPLLLRARKPPAVTGALQAHTEQTDSFTCPCRERWLRAFAVSLDRHSIHRTPVCRHLHLAVDNGKHYPPQAPF
jgi:hypothetical protein